MSNDLDAGPLGYSLVWSDFIENVWCNGQIKPADVKFFGWIVALFFGTICFTQALVMILIIIVVTVNFLMLRLILIRIWAKTWIHLLFDPTKLFRNFRHNIINGVISIYCKKRTSFGHLLLFFLIIRIQLRLSNRFTYMPLNKFFWLRSISGVLRL